LAHAQVNPGVAQRHAFGAGVFSGWHQFLEAREVSAQVSHDEVIKELVKSNQ
jgi:hypothetical protein